MLLFISWISTYDFDRSLYGPGTYNLSVQVTDDEDLVTAQTWTIEVKSPVKKEENNDRVKLFQEEIKNIEKLATSIYELREKKIVQAALSKVRGGKPDLKNALMLEKRLFAIVP